MSMNVKSPSPPFIFFVKKCDLPSVSSKISVTPSLLCQIYADPPFLGRQKVNDPPLNSSDPPPLLKNECSLTKHELNLGPSQTSEVKQLGAYLDSNDLHVCLIQVYGDNCLILTRFYSLCAWVPQIDLSPNGSFHSC